MGRRKGVVQSNMGNEDGKGKPCLLNRQMVVVNIIVGVSGIVIHLWSIHLWSIFHDGDRYSEKGERGVRDSSNEFEGRLELSDSVDEINELYTGAGGSSNAVIEVVEKELRNDAGVH